jgi:hypothetical protein
MMTVQTHFDEPTGTNGPVFGNIDPDEIDLELMPAEQSTHTVTLAFAPPTPQRTVDVVFVVDESGSMEGEQAWLTEMVTDLNTALSTEGITDNRFARSDTSKMGVSSEPLPERRPQNCRSPSSLRITRSFRPRPCQSRPNRD